MHQRDYILRIIEQLGAALVELRRRILGGGATPEATRQELARVAGQAGFDLELLRGFDLVTLRMLVAPTGEVEPARCWLMAEVLYLDGLEASLRGDDGAPSLTKARALYELVKPMGGMLLGLPEALARIEDIDALLSDPGEPSPRSDGGPRVRARRVRAARA